MCVVLKLVEKKFVTDNCSNNSRANFLDLLKKFVQIELIIISPIDSNSNKNSCIAP